MNISLKKNIGSIFRASSVFLQRERERERERERDRERQRETYTETDTETQKVQKMPGSKKYLYVIKQLQKCTHFLINVFCV